MMRYVFAVLVLANLGLLMWASWYRGEPATTIPPRPILHPELMVPLATPGVALKSRRNERSAPPLIAAKPKSRCATVGPLGVEAAAAASTWLAGAKFVAARREEAVQVVGSYWVHLGPFTDRRLAETRLKELEQLGVHDMLIMPDVDGRPAISLGLFTQAENAQHRMQELTQKGVDARQDIRYRTETRVWFDLRLPEPADEAVARLRAHDWSATDVEIRDGGCPSEPSG
jgi:hypothetical protein